MAGWKGSAGIPAKSARTCLRGVYSEMLGRAETPARRPYLGRVDRLETIDIDTIGGIQKLGIQVVITKIFAAPLEVDGIIGIIE